jgi:hypothetical protein
MCTCRIAQNAGDPQPGLGVAFASVVSADGSVTFQNETLGFSGVLLNGFKLVCSPTPVSACVRSSRVSQRLPLRTCAHDPTYVSNPYKPPRPLQSTSSSATQSSSQSSSPSASPSQSETPSMSTSQMPTGSISPSQSTSSSQSATSTQSGSITATQSPSISTTQSTSISQTQSLTASASPTASQTHTQSASQTASQAATPTSTGTPSQSVSGTRSGTQTVTTGLVSVRAAAIFSFYITFRGHSTLSDVFVSYTDPNLHSVTIEHCDSNCYYKRN